MKVSCPSCQAKYNIADDKVKGKKVKVRCKSCGTQILVDGNAAPVSSIPPDEQGTETASAIPSESPPVPEIPEPEAPNTWTVNFSDTDERSLTTAEIADMAVEGQLADEVFVWKEGMDDWQAVTSVPELASAIAAARARAQASQKPAKASEKKTAGAVKHEAGASSPPAAGQDTAAGPIVAAPGSALAKKMASAKSAAAQKKGVAAEAAKPESRDEPAASNASAPATAESPVAPKAATKFASKRQTGTHDLFAAVEKAGSEIDVVTETDPREGASKATGARNENSVLFSLDALKSGMLGGAPAPAAVNQPAPPGPGPRRKAPGPPAKRLEDLMAVDVGPGPTLGRGGGGLLLSGNDALLAAPPPPPPKPEPKPVSVAPAAAAGDVVMAPPPKRRLGLFIGLAVGLVALGAGGSFLLMKSSSSKEGAEAAASSASAAARESAVAAKSAAGAASSAPTEAAKNDTSDAGAAVAAASASPGAAAQPLAIAKPGGGGGVKPPTGKPGTSEQKTTEKEKKESKPAEPAAPSGAGSFNKDAAVAALSVAASQATVCKRPEGPWGSGRAVVTFASSGRVTTANVTGDPFGGTAVGGCVASVFRRAKIPPFSGDPVTVSKSFTIAP